MTYRSSCNQTTLWTAYDGFAHFGKDRRELVSVTVETWKDNRAYKEDIHEKAAEYRLCEGVLAPVIEVKQFPCNCCQYTAPATECVAICTYQAIPFNFENTPSVWTWTVVGGTIVSGQGTDTIDVQTVSGVDVAVDITVVATDPASGGTAGATGVVQHCHEDVTVCPIFIGPPFTDGSFPDGYVLNGFTTADRFFGYITTYALVGNWPAGAVIDVNTGVISGTLTGVGNYTGLQVSAYGDGRCPIAYSNTFSVEITDPQEETLEITETVGGACDWDAGTGGCTATGTYLATPAGFATPPDTWFWEVTTLNAVIESGQGSDTVIVSTTGGVNVTFTLKATASNASGESAIDTGQFLHTHTDPIEETLLVSEVVAGSCDYQLPSTLCSATGTYTASPGGFNIAPDNWVWEVVTGAGIIDSGQGTSTVVVHSDASNDVTFTLKATATNLFTGETANDEGIFTHEHTQLSSTLLALPLLQDRYESGGGTNHALLSRNSEAPVQDVNGDWFYAYPEEFRFPNTERSDYANGIDYGAGVLGVQYVDPGASDGLRIEEAAENLFPDSVNMVGDVDVTYSGEQVFNDPWWELTDSLTTDQGLWRFDIFNVGSAGWYTIRFYLKKDNTVDGTVFVRPVNADGTGGIVIRPDTGAWDEYSSSTAVITRTDLGDHWEYRYAYEYQGSAGMIFEITVLRGTIAGSPNNSNVPTGTISLKEFQINHGTEPQSYLPTTGQWISRENDDVHCLWPAGVVNDFSISCEWIPDYDTASTLLESGNFRIFYTGSALNVTNGNGTAVFTMTVVPETFYYVQAEFSSTDGIIVKVNTVNGTPHASVLDMSPDVNLQIGARANLTEFINGTIKNINMTTEPLPSGNPTFDSTTVTFDSTAYTMDMT